MFKLTITIGLTGGIATGKSTVSNIFKEHNIPVIDADIEARLVVEKDSEAYHLIVEEFGESILHPDGQLNRQQLGAIIFSDEKKRQRLNEITHPRIRQQMLEKKNQSILNKERLVVLDIPLLFESKLQTIVDKVLVVSTDPTIQLNRLMERNGFSKEEALQRIHAQMPLEEKEQLADVVIYNNGTQEELRASVEALIQKWLIKR